MRPNAHDGARRARKTLTAWGPYRPAPSHVPPCIDPAARPMLLLYALSSCGDEEALAFEAHILACEACFQDLKVLDRAGLLIREFTASGSPVRVRVHEALKDLRPRGGIASPPPQHRV